MRLVTCYLVCGTSSRLDVALHRIDLETSCRERDRKHGPSVLRPHWLFISTVHINTHSCTL
jgi:hypothetical protein